MGMTEEEVKSYILRKLGNSIVEVELADADLNDVMRDAKRWMATRVGSKSYREVWLLPSTGTYTLDKDVIEVIRVHLPSTHFPAVDTDDFSYTYSLLFGQWRSPGASPMPYSDLVQRLQYLETAQRIFSADREWKFDPRTKQLDIMPAPSILGPMIVEVWSSVIDTRDLLPEDEDLFLRRALAEAKITLGNIRRKFAQYTTVGGERGLNGEILIQEGQKEKEDTDKQALLWKHAVPFIIG